MAIAVNGGHVSRAIDFFEKEGKYLAIGGSQAWTNEPSPDAPQATDFKLRDVIGLKKIDNTFLVIPDDESGSIVYRDHKWRVVPKEIKTTVSAAVTSGSDTIPLTSVAGLSEGLKMRINNLYEGTIISITGSSVKLNKVAPANIPENSPAEGGALIEGAKYVYVEGYLEYDSFPLETYRQIGLCSGVIPVDPANANILKSAAYSTSGNDEYSSLGILEILDNRAPITRDISMRELISMVIEF